MAIIHQGKKTLNKKANQYLLTSCVCVGMIAAYGYLLFGNGAGQQMNPVFHLLPVVWLLGAVYYVKKYKRFRAGAEGESDLLRQIRQLPNTYHVFTNFLIQERGIRDEIDFVIVGERGVFVVEGKNHIGRIVGTADAVEWQQHKLGKGSKPYMKKMANPVRQTDWHTINLARLLKNHGLDTAIKGILVFTNAKVTLAVESASLVVLKGSMAVNPFILQYQSPHKPDKNQVKSLVRYLTEYSKK